MAKTPNISKGLPMLIFIVVIYILAMLLMGLLTPDPVQLLLYGIGMSIILIIGLFLWWMWFKKLLLGRRAGRYT